jgi:thiamine-monophosphate kinase
MLGPGVEFDRIRAIARALGDTGEGLGDDCAFLAGDLCVSVDVSSEGVHFRREWLAPEEIGWRAAAAALSDLAAVGATPEALLVGLTAPGGEPEATLTGIMAGVGDAVRTMGGRVVGGDLTAGPALAVAVTVLGRAARPIRRGGARIGDGLWVTGALGGPRAALAAWQDGARPDPDSRERFARPLARIAQGRLLADRGATAMIDLSDGLGGDARHLAAASGVGLAIDLTLVPMAPGVAQAARAANQPGPVFAARGGEDYELLVTLPAEVEAAAPAGTLDLDGVPLTRIGRVGDDRAVRFALAGADIDVAGYDHFG